MSLPPDPFPPVRTYRWKAGRPITRIHPQDYGSTSFNPGRGSPTRFAPLLRPTAPPIPHLYGASTYECAAHETVFHEIQFDAPVKTVPKSDLAPLLLSYIKCVRPLELAALFEPDLNAWHTTRRELIDTYATAYHETVLWALAIHATSNVDGLIWTSRRSEQHKAMILFGDRVLPGELEDIASQAIATSARPRRQIEDFANRAGIALV